MSQALEKYLDRIMIFANRNETEAPLVRAELKDHLLKKISDLEEDHLPREDAVFQAIELHGNPRIVGYGLRPKFPWIDVRSHGTAQGFLAIGPKAKGVIAIGGAAFGLFSIGGFSAGLFSIGGFALGMLFALGGFSLAPLGLAYGGFAVGLFAFGGFAIGITAFGGRAIGIWASGAKVISLNDPDNMPVFLAQIKSVLAGKRFSVFINIIFWPIFLIGMILQVILTRKEFNRVKNADPTLVQ